jgi:sugar phosphate permease
VYVITYIAYSLIHIQREFWSLSKPYIFKQHPELSKKILSRFDTAQMFFYAISLYICGIIGDTYNLRYVLSFAYAGLTIFFALLSLPGFLDLTN